MIRKTFLIALVSSLLGAGTAASVSAAEKAPYKVVVNSANPVESFKSSDLAAYFLKKKTSWPTGARISLVQPKKGSAARKAFESGVIKKSDSALASYWQQLVFSGRDVPPAEKENDAAIVQFVSENKDAIGYVAGDAPTDAVKVVAVTE